MQLADRLTAPFRRAEGGPREGLLAGAPMLVTAALVVVIAAQLASLLWRLLASTGTEAPEPLPLDLPAAPVFDLSTIVNAHLFGVSANAGDPSAAPATNANLVLAGTIAGLEPAQGWAIIGANAGAARVFATGATVPGGARLVAVYPDRVILERGGVRESLALPRLTGGAGPIAVAYSPAAAQPASLADSVRELLVQHPGAATDLLRPQPVFAGGQMRGYRVYPGRNRSQFAKLGLQPGDLVTAVNGAALDDPNRGLEMLRGIGAGTAVTLTIDRGGQQQQLTVDTGAVAQELQPVGEPEPPPEETE